MTTFIEPDLDFVAPQTAPAKPVARAGMSADDLATIARAWREAVDAEIRRGLSPVEAQSAAARKHPALALAMQRVSR